MASDDNNKLPKEGEKVKEGEDMEIRIWGGLDTLLYSSKGNQPESVMYGIMMANQQRVVRL